MPSIHTHKAIEKAERQGGFAALNPARDLWDLPKRELVELVMRQAALLAGDPDATDGGTEARRNVETELRALRRAGIL